MNWYNYLNKEKENNLISRETINENDIIICWHNKRRKYGVFQSYHDFKTFQNSVDEKENCFYEVMLPGKGRKVYFDVDIEIQNGKNLDNIIILLKNSIKKVLSYEKCINMLVFTSHTDKKLSYHVILKDLYLKDERACISFYKLVLKNIDDKYHNYIDSSVYKKTQQFRLLGSHKYEKNNTKIYDHELSENIIIPKRCKNIKAVNNHILYSSMISNISLARLLDKYNEEEKEINNNLIMGSSSTADLEDILNIFYNNDIIKTSYDEFVYISAIENNGNVIVSMKRNRPTYCKICKRVHENENPYILVKGMYRNVYFNCRRSLEEGTYIGSLGEQVYPDIDINDIPIIKNIDNIEDEDKKLELSFPICKLLCSSIIKKDKYIPKNNYHGIELKMY